MLRLSWIPLWLGFVALAWPCVAQDTPTDARREGPPQTAAEPGYSYNRTADVMFYERERERYESPQMMVRRRAELRGLQRAERLASLKWYGKSNMRPMVNPNPRWGGGYAPYWGSNTYNPDRWRPYNSPITRQDSALR